MVINVKFSKIWTVEEVQEYILNPNDEKYVNMPNDIYLELITCAEYYATMSYFESNKDDWIDDYMKCILPLVFVHARQLCRMRSVFRNCNKSKVS